MTTNITKLKNAIRFNDKVLVAAFVRDAREQGLSEGQIYRLALAADPEITRPVWIDMLLEAGAGVG